MPLSPSAHRDSDDLATRLAYAHDASHFRLVPARVVIAEDAEDVARVLRASAADGRAVTFRSGGTSLSGQASGRGTIVDVRREFRRIVISPDGARVTAQPGATVRQVNARLAKHARRLGPDPASEIACTVGGVIANNSSGMACGTHANAYATLDSMVVVLASGTIIDSAADDADETLRRAEPALHAGLADLRARLLARPDLVAEVRRQYAIKNTMGYGLNALLDHERPVDILTHLLVGSEGTLGFVASVTFRTVPAPSHVATALLVFPDLRSAAGALPALVATGLTTVELMDATSLRVAGRSDAPAAIADLEVHEHAALLIEHQRESADELARAVTATERMLGALPLTQPVAFTADPAERAALWHTRKGLYATIAGARPSGTTALLEDIAVPADQLLATCEGLVGLFERHGYRDAVVFGHAKDGNLHFMLTERFDDPLEVERYRGFTEDLVDLVLGHGGSLKAEHGTGRVMAPFVRRQFGDELYALMREIKSLVDPAAVLNPGVLLDDDPESYLRDLDTASTVEPEVDRCVECGYCEPGCPSRDLTLTPRQRIVLRRERAAAEGRGDQATVRAIDASYRYDGVDTCAVDGMCAVACPVGINTGDLVRRLRHTAQKPLEETAWDAAARGWGAVVPTASLALTVADRAPAPLVTAVTDVARSVLGADTVPRYDAGLPPGGPRRRPTTAHDARADAASAVLLPACVGSMFGTEDDTPGASAALRALADRAGVALVIPDDVAGLCCGTPWKSKGHDRGYERMSSRVRASLARASGGGAIPILTDAASCTEGLVTMHERAGDDDARILDAVEFAATVLLPRLTVRRRLGSLALHPTCSTTRLGADGALRALAAAIADEVHVPADWGCCAFAGDRGLLHPELTASATRAEAAEVGERSFDAYASANRTCEIGMRRAAGSPYRHILELLDEATRP
ncbi:FAD-binding and (Fe-S)-binding domain-containing protein [Galbitalea sp. SE-J8]|uniref:FAD-binding and (Fe-S)-binding domain-containing protein n=1 Tax=Galbitalea sp. SE-J8 TaxID=3054952 RepID=UPI00259CAA16|nr:FAD-binding and (Fe-S)-binding domain-containing protein [Galbitalea sp. SE-J8]MDM4762067.1 FAD-binding and (Fe-S)-binding domain-containing protein [Galbitalea sp. SE-J8]